MDISTCVDLEEVKLILSDFDYTFLDSDHNVSDANAEAFGQVAAAGVVTAIASGRSRGGTLSCLSPAHQGLMKYNGFPGVFLNGGVVYGQDGKILSCTEIPLPAQSMLLAKMKDMGILQNVLGYTADRVLCIEKNSYTEKNCLVFREPAAEVLPYEEFAATRFVKLVACGSVESTDKARPILEKAVGEHLRCVRPLDWNLEFINPSVSKAVGAKVLLTHLNLTPSQLLAMGDGENDIEVLGLAGISVAVANACPAAKSAAKYTTVSNNESAFSVVAGQVLKARQKAGRNNSLPQAN
ncbi:haloacid dehalogenase-like hydrolase domain-containing protein, putative [Eimeria acervulina]|uniref:Haloacid dehalogenase-like hydrolase domain-containing protein, putative n=1 Tax=Eimeria acervulina TaxID=5801 RepID=U6GE98_EIMAC|nr:haloacid dehalogenase-like hydrolase domain-containing protein, putative [Eimeria acervulina]CDI76904.1 haloacid dehalogenase-like hydrolase domain-containing protein, putative [Eimeria acervulina]